MRTVPYLRTLCTSTLCLAADMPARGGPQSERYKVAAHVFTQGGAPMVAGSPSYLASVSIGQRAIAGSPAASGTFSLFAGYQPTTEGFRPGYDGSLDSAGNGIPDLWEIRHFGGAGKAPAYVEKRGRDVSTYDVYVWGVDPSDPDAVLKFSALHFMPSGATLAFNSSFGRLYDVLTSSNLVEKVWLPLPGHANMPGDGTPIIIDDPEAWDHPVRFYRIEIKIP